MSIIKRQNKNKKVFYNVEIYIRGVRMAFKQFYNKAEAHSWHDRVKEKLLVDPKALRAESKKRTLLEVIKLYKKEKFPF